MCRHALVALIFWATALPAYAQIRIAVSDRAPNGKGGYCAWAAAETCCRHLGFRWCRGLVKMRQRMGPGKASAVQVAGQLRALGVKCRYVKGNRARGRQLVHWALARGYPAIVSVTKMHNTRGKHAIVIMEKRAGWFRYFDCNNIHKDFWHRESWFNSRFSGMVVVVVR